jgi:hypothetical protein
MVSNKKGLVSIFLKKGEKIRSNTLNLPISNLASSLALEIKQLTMIPKSG